MGVTTSQTHGKGDKYGGKDEERSIEQQRLAMQADQGAADSCQKKNTQQIHRLDTMLNLEMD